MNQPDVANQRLLHQRIAGPHFDRAAQVVAWLGAVQAQDYQQALWAIALRTKHATLVDVEQAIADRQIVLTWPMRGTIHAVSADDVRGMLELCASRKISSDSLRFRQLGLDEHILERCAKLLGEALEGGQILTRAAIFEVFAQAGIDPKNQRGYHILWRLAQAGLICFGPRQGKEQTFVLLEHWLPNTPRPSRQEALSNLTERYFISHGPATVQDFAGWAGLTLTETRSGLESVSSKLVSFKQEDREYWCGQPGLEPATPASTVYLLPGFDEYLLGYKDRRDVLAAEHAGRIVPGGNGVFLPMIVMDGQVVGTWRRTIKKRGFDVELEPFVAVPRLKVRVEHALERYSVFLGLPLNALKIHE